MRLGALQKLFLARYPTGALSRARAGEFFVQFRSGGRIYRYRDTVSGLAERLGLVPPRDLAQVASEVVAKLAGGASEVIALAGASEIASWTRDGWIMEVPDGRDSYGRLVARYYIELDQDDWSSTQ